MARSIKKGVITSYSIHYTKLYDFLIRWRIKFSLSLASMVLDPFGSSWYLTVVKGMRRSVPGRKRAECRLLTFRSVVVLMLYFLQIAARLSPFLTTWVL